MRPIDNTVKTRLLQMHQTLYNNANPDMQIEAIRPLTAIFHKRFWQESIITADTTATSTSIAVRRTEQYGDLVYAAYVSGGTLTVKTAALVFPVNNMIWNTVLTISGCLDVVLEFDGHFVTGTNKKIEYYTDELPWLFYTTTTGQLMGGIIGTTYETVVGANVTSFDAIRGIRGLMGTNHGIDEGLLVFYVLNGVVFYRPYKYGEWGTQEIVSIAPENIVNIKAERTFDWRIVLQVEDTLGKLYEVFTESYVSGNTNVEFLQILPAKIDFTVTDIRYHNAQAPVEYIAMFPAMFSLVDKFNGDVLLRDAENVSYTDEELEIENDYGYKVRIRCHERVYGSENAYTGFSLVDSESTSFSAVAIAYTENPKVVEVTFFNFNNAVGDVSVVYDGTGGLTGDLGQTVPASSTSFTPTELVPYIPEPPVVLSIINIQAWEESI